MRLFKAGATTSGVPYTGATQDLNLGTNDLLAETVQLNDSNDTHHLILLAGSDLTADRNLTLTTGDAARTVTLNGNPTLADWFDQSVKAAASPTFANITDSGLTASELVASNGSKQLVSLAVATYPSLAEIAFIKGLTSAVQTQLNAKATSKLATWPINQQTVSASLNAQDFYALAHAVGSFTCTKARIYVNAIGGDPTNLDLKVLNAAGAAVVGSLSATVLISALGALDLTFATPFNVVDKTDYWIGIAGDSSNSSFAATTASLNNIAWNRFAGNSTVQSTIPAGTTTATRICIELLP